MILQKFMETKNGKGDNEDKEFVVGEKKFCKR